MERVRLKMQSRQRKTSVRKSPLEGDRGAARMSTKTMCLSIRDRELGAASSFLWKLGGMSSEESGCVWSRVEWV